jgi:hypothetical protein
VRRSGGEEFCGYAAAGGRTPGNVVFGLEQQQGFADGVAGGANPSDVGRQRLRERRTGKYAHRTASFGNQV